MLIFWILVSGALGVLCRYGVETLFTDVSQPSQGFPFGTFIVNILGCLIAGFVFQQYVIKHPEEISSSMLTVIFVGFLGGLTTFSGYCLQTLRLWTEGQFPLLAIFYLLLSPVVGLLSVFLGSVLSKKLFL